jgi:murein DD-endopeptidase MepM/ murein hydrolase activator NlpD
LNIILVTGANVRARTLTVGWQHAVAGTSMLLVALAAFALLVNFVANRWSADGGPSWLHPPDLADAGDAASHTDDRVQGHLNAMAVRLGELQAQLARLDGLGQRLARSAGLKPQDLQGLEPGTIPGRGGAIAKTLPIRDYSVTEFAGILETLKGQLDGRAEQFGVLETALDRNFARRQFMPSQKPVADGWYSSNFGYRIDPFTGQNTFHEGIDFPAETGTPIVAAAGGRVVAAGLHAQYGRMVEIDHGNGLITRYAHASQLNVRQGDVVVRGQRVATVGSTGRSTGPHLHFEVRLNGVPQNPARFLQASG